MRFILLGVLILASAAWGQDCEIGAFGCGHGTHHHKYKEWKAGNGGSCCSNEDCRPVRARLEDHGWVIWIPEFRRWIPVPHSVVGEPDRFRDGRSHVCSSKPVIGLPVFHIYCFSPTGSKS